MTLPERRKAINDVLVSFKGCYDHFFPGKHSLSDKDYEDYIHEMDAIARKYQDTSISELSWKLCQAFLDDTERVHKKWLERENEEHTK